MPPLQVSFSGFAIIGASLFMLAITISVFVLRQATSRTTWLLAGFFVAVAASGIATVLTNTFLFWEPIFDPWQDFFVLLGGVSLALFAYRFPRNDQPREAKLFLIPLIGLAVIAAGYALIFDIRYAFAYTPGFDVAEWFYVLMPLGTLLVVIIFVRRSAHYSALALAHGQASDEVAAETAVAAVTSRSFLWRVFHPQGNEAKGLLGFGLALTLGFLPGFSVLFSVPGPFDFLMLHIGSLLALATVALVYFNYAPGTTSFMAKLVGITLLTLLVVLSVTATLNFRQTRQDYDASLRNEVMLAYAAVLANQPALQPPNVVYVVSWPADAPANAAGYNTVYTRPDTAQFELNTLIAQNQQQALQLWSRPISSPLSQMTQTVWSQVSRYHTYPAGSGDPDFIGWGFTQNNTAYEIGFSFFEREQYLSSVTLNWIIAIVLTSLTLLIVFPLFFQVTLVKPLKQLLDGVARVKQGDLSTSVPIRYYDEIGSLTDSFNTLTRTLQSAYDVLEQRVADRTRELAAFSELIVSSAENDDLKRTLEPALNRILEAGHCQGLALHLVSEDKLNLELISQRQLPGDAVSNLQTIPLAGAFAARVFQDETFLVTNEFPSHADLPAAFNVKGGWVYLGSPLATAGESHGWLSCYRESHKPFSTSETTFMMAMARQIGVIVENHRLRHRISQIAIVEERQRLARDLHDSVSQLLYSLTLFARAGREAAADGDALRLNYSLEQIDTTSLQTQRTMRSLLYELLPPSLKEKGLTQVLAERFDVVERRVGIQVDYYADESVWVPEDMERDVYFVVTEALNNSLKHAAATRLAVNLAQTHDHLEVRIADNGRGFELEKRTGGLGLQNMRSRVDRLKGTFEIMPRLNEGTQIRILIPCESSVIS